MLLGARQFFEKRGTPTPPLPYDAEVEYLESTGTQRIDTGIKIDDNDFVLTSEFQLTRAPVAQWCGYFGTYTSEFAASTRIINYSNTLAYYYGGYRRKSNSQTAINLGHVYGYSRLRFVLEYMRFRVYENNILIKDVATPAPNGQEDTSTVGLMSGAYCKMFLMHIAHNGDAVLDMIPVRFTNEQGVDEGAMYDRVSGALFRNAGTGAFVIGPDKS